MFKIETGIALPDPAPFGGKGCGRREKYPLSKMEPGQSMFIPGANRGRIGAIVSGANKRLAHRFVTRKWSQDGLSGIRIFCVDKPAPISLRSVS